MRTDWGFVHQNPRDGLRMTVSAGANVGERLMAVGERHYGRIRATAIDWLDRVEIDDRPHRRRPAQLLRRHAPAPADRPQPRHRARAWSSWTSRPAASTSRCRRGCSTCCAAWSPTRLAVVIVTHDLAVARLLSAPHDGDEGRPGDRDRPDRPGARRSARALHPASRLLDPAGLTMTTPRLELRDVAKSFTMHLRDGIVPAGRRRRLLHASRPANASCSAGRRAPARARSSRWSTATTPSTTAQILVDTTTASVDIAAASPRAVLAARRDTIGYVSQFLRVIPRVPALRHRRRAADRARRRPRRGARAAAERAARAAQPAASGSGTCRRPPSPAASSSGSTSRAASSPATRSSCSTSRPPRSTPTNRAVVVDLIARGEGGRRGASSASSTTRRCARPSPTASST